MTTKAGTRATKSPAMGAVGKAVSGTKGGKTAARPKAADPDTPEADPSAIPFDAVMAAKRIYANHCDIDRSLTWVFYLAVETGHLLRKAKDALGHGEYGKWVKKRCRLSERTAREYKRLAENEDRIRELAAANGRRSKELTIHDALALLRQADAEEATVPDAVDATDREPADRADLRTKSTPASTAKAPKAAAKPERDGGKRASRPAATPGDSEPSGSTFLGDVDTGLGIDDGDHRAAVVDAATGQDSEATDEAWLEQSELRAQLADPRAFDRQALLWRRVRPALARLAGEVGEVECGYLKGPMAKLAPLHLDAILHSLATTEGPESWVKCEVCDGGHRRAGIGACLACHDHGFLPGDYRVINVTK